jgi:hypothetical protein
MVLMEWQSLLAGLCSGEIGHEVTHQELPGFVAAQDVLRVIVGKVLGVGSLLMITPATLKIHTRCLRRKLGISSRVDMAILALQHHKDPAANTPARAESELTAAPDEYGH